MGLSNSSIVPNSSVYSGENFSDIYCGNNLLDDDLVSGRKRIGSKYQCFKRGIGVGLNLPFDGKYLLPYEPIHDEKIYCGNNLELPNGYHRNGTQVSCLQKGVAVGKKMNAERNMGGELEEAPVFNFKSKKSSKKVGKKSSKKVGKKVKKVSKTHKKTLKKTKK